MKLKKIAGIIVAANLAVGMTTFAQDAQDAPSRPDGPTLTPALPEGADEPAGAATQPFDKETFLKESAKSGVAEVNMAQIGTQKAQDPALKEAAKKLVNDHSKLNDQLKELAQKKDVTLSTEVDQKHQKMIDHLSGLSGSEFDKAFAMHMVKGHKKSIERFKQAAKADDTEISQLAKSTLPTLQEHLTMIQKWAPNTTAGAAVEEPAGAESDQPKDDSSGAAPEYKSPSDPNKSDSPN